MGAPFDVEEWAGAIVAGDRPALARAITLVESSRRDHRERAGVLLDSLLEHTGAAVRLGITGVPGVGKSTFIDQFGTNLTSSGLRVAVLAVDPTSQRTGGSILGDKTRMERLAVDPAAFIRPSPAGSSLGGVARATREAMLLCEAAGFDVIVVETVGVGQSETTVASMVDFFLVLMLPGAGDELQGIKKGVLELADMVVVNKADGDNARRARAAAADYRHALHLLEPSSPDWRPPVDTCSALTNEGLDRIWSAVLDHRDIGRRTGALETRRRRQLVEWMWAMIRSQLEDRFRQSDEVAAALTRAEAEVAEGLRTASAAAEALLDAYEHRSTTLFARRDAVKEG
ncbi:MAG: methylmalonyl Co-A mutase-associated GTPase MeaB [Microthrixaceae bacterium]